MNDTPHINTLREHLMATLASLRDRENPMEPDRARAIGQVASVLVDSARVENEYLKISGGSSQFIEPSDASPAPEIATRQGAHNPFPVSVRHRLGD